VQTAVKGGTGQTTFTKGDLLVATSASVLSKLAVGTQDGQTLIVDSSVASGVKWANNQTNKVAVSPGTSVVGGAVATESSVMAVTIPGSTLGTNNVVRATLYVDNLMFGTAGSVLLQANFGGTVTGSVMIAAGAAISAANALKGKIEYVVFANSSINAQLSNFVVNLSKDKTEIGSLFPSVVAAFSTGVSSVNSDANRTLGITARFSNTDADNRVGYRGYIVEKIV
jgi:hypothetical protein